MADGGRASRKGLPGSRRRPYCIATAALLHDESGPVATPGGPYGRTAAIFRSENGAGNGKKRGRFFQIESAEIQNFHDTIAAREGLTALPGGPYGNEKSPSEAVAGASDRRKQNF